MQLEKTIVVIKTIIIWKDYLNNMILLMEFSGQ